MGVFGASSWNSPKAAGSDEMMIPRIKSSSLKPPTTSNRKIRFPDDKPPYRKRHKTTNMFGRPKDWRRIHTRYDHTFMSAAAIAAIVIFWI